MRKLVLFFLIFCWTLTASAQITITSSDMFNAVGLYYNAWSNTSDVNVAPYTSSVSSPYFWDFSSGPEDKVILFEYVDPAEDGHNGDFPDADLAERKTDTTEGTVDWMFLEQIPATGRVNYGFYSETFCSNQPSTPFQPAIVDFPDPINYQDGWNVATTFYTQIYSMGTWYPAYIDYSAAATVDAYGMVNLPQIGFGDCLRVNELAQYDVYVDLGLGGYMYLSTEYVRNYYWLMEDHGIAVQISSQQQDSPPPSNFTTASAFLRMFETNHPSGNLPPDPVTDLQVIPQGNMAVITWSEAANAEEYRVEYSDHPWFATGVEILGVTDGNFMLDNINGVSKRFYRVISLNSH